MIEKRKRSRELKRPFRASFRACAPWLAALVALAGCFRPTFHNVECGPDRECPPGLDCAEDGVCRDPGYETPSVDAAPDDAAPDVTPEGRCANPGVVTDAFEGPAPAPFWLEFGVGAAVTDGTLRIAPPPNLAQGNIGYVTNTWFDLREGGASVRAQIATANGVRTHFSLTSFVSGVAIVFAQQGSQLTAYVEDDFQLLSSHSVTYDPVAHRFWRISEHAGKLYFEVSRDGSDWNAFHQWPTPARSHMLRLALAVSVPTPVATPGTVSFDDLNGAVPRADWCPTSQLFDDFDDGMIDLAWADVGSTVMDRCTPAELDGAAVLSLAAEPVTCWFGTGHAFDLTNGEIAVEVELDPFPPTLAVELTALDQADAGLSLRLRDGLITARAFARDGTPLIAPTPSPIEDHRYWRIAHAPDGLHFQTSNDRSTWVNRYEGSVPAGIDISGLRVYLRAMGEGAAATVRFARYN